MKLLTTFAITAAMLAAPAIAMAKDCGNPPAKLSLPNGASATEEEMKATQAKFPGYAKEVSAYMKCLNDQVKAAKDEYEAVTADWTKQQNAFKKADAYFTADNEPTDLLEAWRADNGDGNAAITQFSSDGLSPDAPNAKTRKDAADCLAALAKADKDAEKIANGG